MFEKRWGEITPRSFTANGGTEGQVTVADTHFFKAKQIIIIKADTEADLILEVKRVLTPTILIVGPKSTPITGFTNLAAYTTAKNATIQAHDQSRPQIKPEDYNRAVYEEEPTVALRTTSVDYLGRMWSTENPFPVQITDTTPTNPAIVKIAYNSISALAMATLTTITTYTAPLDKITTLQRISFSGTNIAEYTMLIDAATIEVQRTYFSGPLNGTADFSNDNAGGLIITPGSIISIKVIHNRSFVGDFNATIKVLEA